MKPLLTPRTWLVALGLTVFTATTTPAKAETRAPCTSALLDPEASGVPVPVVALAEARVRDQLAAAGCPTVDRATVLAMRKMLGLRGVLTPAQILQLGKSLLVRSVLLLELQGLKTQIALELSAYAPATGDAQHRSARVPASELLAKVVELAAELAPSDPEPEPAGTASAAGATDAPALGSSAAAVPAAPPTAPVVTPAPVSEPSAAISGVAPSTTVSGPTPTPTPTPQVAPPTPIAAPAAAPAPTPAPAPPPPLVVKRAPSTEQLVLAAVALQAYYMFGQSRGGPALELELGSGSRRFHGSGLFRVYPGDATGYLLGGRLEGRPGWGRLRLVLGGELGLIFVPGNDATIDMVLLGVQPLGVSIEWKHLRITARVLGLDVYLVPANQSVDGEVESIYGLSHGVSLAVF